jgi:hypothetical protein
VDGAIGPYTIEAELGRGGMGVVYRAHDPRLHRTVAIKALPQDLASDPSRLERFEREARTLAQLNHPNLVGIHGLEVHDARTFLVLEFVEGETLAERLDRGPLPPDEAIELGAQIAAGVEAAHEAGVIHRDLKPANIIITPEGVAKVLDFGLARIDETGSSSMVSEATLTTAARHSPTMPGVILGTAAYMSPEQARGRRVDKRSDIWSFGVVLFEMLTGASPFVGETISDSIGAVLHKNCDFALLPDATPARVRRVLARCLERDKSRRYRDIGDARLDLVEDEAPADEHPDSPGRLLPWTLAIVALLACAGALALAFSRAPQRPAPLPLVKFAFACPVPEDPGSTLRAAVAISPDGSMIAAVADDDAPIYLRRIDQTTVRPLDLPWPATLLNWTRDGRWLLVLRGSVSQGEIWRVSPTGESPRLVCELPDEGFVWANSVRPLDDETLVFSMTTRGIFTVPLRGGTPTPLLLSEPGELIAQPTPIPGTDAIVFLEINTGRVEMLRAGERTILVDLEGDRLNLLNTTETGDLMVSVFEGKRSQGTYLVPFDPASLRVTGDPVQILPLAMTDTSTNGTLVYAPRIVLPAVNRNLVWVNREGIVEARIGAPLPEALDAALSPDGSRIAVSTHAREGNEDDGVTREISIIDARTGARFELNDPLGYDYSPAWRDDAQTIVYTTYNSGVRRSQQRSISANDQPQTIVERALITRPSDDGRFLLTSMNSLHYIETGSTERRTFLSDATSHFDLNADSRYLAYVPGAGKGIRIQRFPEGGPITTVTTLDARAPQWSPDDSELFFWADGGFYAVHIDIAGPQPIVGTPTRLFDASDANLFPSRSCGITPDGRFLMLQNPDDTPPTPETTDIFVVQSWASQYDRE